MENHHLIILSKEIGEFTVYLTGPKTIDALVDDCSVMDLTELRDEFETLVKIFDRKIYEAGLGLDPDY